MISISVSQRQRIVCLDRSIETAVSLSQECFGLIKALLLIKLGAAPTVIIRKPPIPAITGPIGIALGIIQKVASFDCF